MEVSLDGGLYGAWDCRGMKARIKESIELIFRNSPSAPNPKPDMIPQNPTILFLWFLAPARKNPKPKALSKVGSTIP